MTKQPLHSELPRELTWNLETMYESPEAWEQGFAALEPLKQHFLGFEGRLRESAATLRDAIEALDDLERPAEKLYTYAHLRSDEDTSISANRARVERMEAFFAELSGASAWFEPEVMAIPDAVMERFLDAPELAFYRRSLVELLREKPHTLSREEERILGLASDVMGAPEKIFSALNDADLAFPPVTDENGKKRPLTHGSYRTFLENPDRAVRRRAFKLCHGTYAKFATTFAATLDNTVKEHVLDAKLRHYPSALGAALFDDNVPESIYRKLIETVRGRLDRLGEYFELRRKAMGLKKLALYDLYNPLSDSCRRKYTFEEAGAIVREALKPLGAEYAKHLERAFAERWIDVPECRGKRSGAYSSGCFDSAPYLLLNFQGTLNDVFTLAHELGHSMHSFYSNRAQQYHYADYSIFVAEVASTTNEMLLWEYLVARENDPAMRRYLYCHLLDEVRGTIYRQTMFAEFELRIHELAAQGEVLTSELLRKEYYKLNCDYHPAIAEPDREIDMEWARVPHFYYDFYVYKYATGMSAAMMLSKAILSGDPAARDRYFGFLKAGDSKDVLDIMRDAGVDLSTPQPVEAALDRFGAVVRELAELLNASPRQ